MPGNLLSADTSFPTFTPEQTNEQKLDVVTNYLYMLLEQLRYTLQNLGMGNFNGAELTELGLMISEPISVHLESLEGNLLDLRITTNGLSAQIENVAGSVHDLEITADQLTSQIEDAEGNISAIDQYAKSITLSVTNGETSSTVKLLAGGVQIASQTISMSGLVTFTGLSSGTTTINGACIKTGTIDADRLNLTGAITFNDLSSSVRNDINDAYSMASDAQSTANDAYDTVDKWTYGGTTYIDGAQIMTGTVSASTLEGGEIYLLDGSGWRAGSFTLEGASSYNGRAVTIMSGAISLNAQYGDLYMESGDGAAMQVSSYFRFSGDVTPYTSSNYSLGRSTRTWSDVYADNGEIQTSDQNQKNSIEPLPDKYISMLDNVTPVRYRLNDGASGRYHVGFIAQDVEQAMEFAGVSDLEFGGWIKDVDEDGNTVYMLRYTEMIAILWAKIKKLEQRIEVLEGAA